MEHHQIPPPPPPSLSADLSETIKAAVTGNMRVGSSASETVGTGEETEASLAAASLKESQRLAKLATKSYKDGEYGVALEYYGEALDAIKSCNLPAEKKTLYLNRAAAYQKLWHHEAAVGDCDSALQLDPFNFKALNRRSASKKQLRDVKGAFFDMMAGFILTPPDKNGVLPPPPTDYDELCNAVGMQDAKRQLDTGIISLYTGLPAIPVITSRLAPFSTLPEGCAGLLLAAEEDSSVERLSERLETERLMALHTEPGAPETTLSDSSPIVELRLHRALLLIRSNSFAEAEADIVAAYDLVATSTEPSSSPYWSALNNLRGTFSSLRSDHAGAKKYLEVALVTTPECPNALIKLADVEIEAGSHAAGLALYERAMAAGRALSDETAQNAAVGDVYFFRGKTLVPSDDADQSSLGLAELERAHTLRPTCAHTAMWLAVSCYHKGQSRRAFDLFASAAELDPTLTAVHVFWGKTLMYQECPTEARAKYETALKLQPTHSDALMEMAALMLQLPPVTKESVEESKRLLERAVEAEPSCYAAYVELVKVCMMLGQMRQMMEFSTAGLQCARTEVEMVALCSLRVAGEARLAAMELKKKRAAAAEEQGAKKE